MSTHTRFSISISFISLALAISLIAGVSSSASVKAKGKVVSASLSKTSFTAAQAGTVKLKCRISPKSSKLNYLLQMKKGAKWSKVRSINKKGSFKGTYTKTVKSLFGAKARAAGKYRVKISADGNSRTKSFTIKAPPADGGGGDDGGDDGGATPPPPPTKPTAGHWVTASGNVDFFISADQANVVQFVVEYSTPCSDGSTLSGTTTFMTSDPISGNAFSHTGSTLSYSGTFSSATAAQGTARVFGSAYCGTYDTGSIAWSAAWLDSSQLQIPGVFGKTTPANSAIDVETMPSLYWGASTSALFYEYCVDNVNNNSCDTTWWLTSTPDGFDFLDPNTPYYWQVRAINALGETYADGGAWWSFTTGAT